MITTPCTEPGTAWFSCGSKVHILPWTAPTAPRAKKISCTWQDQVWLQQKPWRRVLPARSTFLPLLGMTATEAGKAPHPHGTNELRLLGLTKPCWERSTGPPQDTPWAGAGNVALPRAAGTQACHLSSAPRTKGHQLQSWLDTSSNTCATGFTAIIKNNYSTHQPCKTELIAWNRIKIYCTYNARTLPNLRNSGDPKELFLNCWYNKYISRQQHPTQMLKHNQSAEYFFKLKNTPFLENRH